jgi:hypothetical protein
MSRTAYRRPRAPPSRWLASIAATLLCHPICLRRLRAPPLQLCTGKDGNCSKQNLLMWVYKNVEYICIFKMLKYVFRNVECIFYKMLNQLFFGIVDMILRKCWILCVKMVNQVHNGGLSNLVLTSLKVMLLIWHLNLCHMPNMHPRSRRQRGNDRTCGPWRLWGAVVSVWAMTCTSKLYGKLGNKEPWRS